MVVAITERHLSQAIKIAREYGAKRRLLFGSALANAETAGDLDLAVEGVPGWDIFRMAAEMEERPRAERSENDWNSGRTRS